MVGAAVAVASCGFIATFFFHWSVMKVWMYKYAFISSWDSPTAVALSLSMPCRTCWRGSTWSGVAFNSSSDRSFSATLILRVRSMMLMSISLASYCSVSILSSIGLSLRVPVAISSPFFDSALLLLRSHCDKTRESLLCWLRVMDCPPYVAKLYGELSLIVLVLLAREVFEAGEHSAQAFFLQS